ncbi:hypothetical protein ABTX35_25865, partial [Streptomyces sp. NPDC096080]
MPKNPTITLLSLGHACVDVYQGAVAALVPFFVAERAYSYAAVSGVVLAASLLSSVAQPLFGLLTDRWMELAREIADVVDTARALWDSWEDDAIVRDVATGRFLDADRVHHIDFEGAAFSVKGPLITPRPPQGQVVVLAPDALDADARADVVLVARDTVPAVA